jgi:hypothetical protein
MPYDDQAWHGIAHVPPGSIATTAVSTPMRLLPIELVISNVHIPIMLR